MCLPQILSSAATRLVTTGTTEYLRRDSCSSTLDALTYTLFALCTYQQASMSAHREEQGEDSGALSASVVVLAASNLMYTESPQLSQLDSRGEIIDKSDKAKQSEANLQAAERESHLLSRLPAGLSLCCAKCFLCFLLHLHIRQISV